MTVDRKRIIDPAMPAIILDIKGLVTRSYHSGTDSHPVRDEATGERVNSAAHGAANFMERILLPILENYPPISIIAVADGGNELRRSVFPTYKVKRQEGKKEHPAAQLKELDKLLEGVNRLLLSLGATIVKVNKREADDVIGALVKKLGSRHKIIYTVDHDLTQLISEENNTHLIDFDTPIFCYKHKFDRAGVKEYIEVEPHLVALFKSLIGDTSDEYPGVKGFGPVKWIELESLVGEAGLLELEQMVATGKFEELKDTVKQNPNLKIFAMLLERANEWRTMYYLAKLQPDSIWGASGKHLIKPEWHKRVPDRQKALNVMTVLGIDDMIGDLEKWFPTMQLGDSHSLPDVLEHLNQHLEDSPVVGFDYEGYDKLNHQPFREASKKGEYVDVMSQVPTGGSFCYGANLQHNVYISTGHRDTANVEQEYLLDVLKEVQSLDKVLVIQNVGFELTVTNNTFGVDENPIVRAHDTRVFGTYFDENMMGIGNDGLKDMSWNLLRYRQTEFKELLEQHGAADMRDLTGQQTLEYGCDDSLTAAHLWVLFRWVLILEEQWDFVLRQHTAPAHILESAFREGIEIDWEELDKLREADQKVITEGNAFIREQLDLHCNEDKMSPEQLEAFAKQRLEAASAFLEADIDAISYQLSEKWAKKNDGSKPGRERMDALLQEFKMKFYEGTRYEPRVEIPREFDFKGTDAQLRDVTAQLGFEPALQKSSNKAIQDWLVNWADTKVSDLQGEFLIRLGAAAGKPLKNRAGPEFEDLKEISLQVMQPLMKSDWVGDELNYDSPVQMQQLLYGKLALPVRRRSKVQKDSFRYDRGFEGSPGTDKRVVAAALAEDCQSDDWRRKVLTTLTEVKAAMTRFELFYVPYPLWKHPVDGRIHAGVKDPGTVTRRPTSGKPNVLQVSKGPTRKAFVPHHQKERTGKVDKTAEAIAKILAEREAEEQAA